MKTPISIQQINSILEAGRTCDDTMAILENLNTEHGIEVVPPGTYAPDVAVMFMYPNGARKVQQELKRGGGSQMQQLLQETGKLFKAPSLSEMMATVPQALYIENDVIEDQTFKPSETVYPAHFVIGGNGSFIVSFRDIPQALTQGDNWEDAVEMATDALSTALEFYFEDNLPVPPPSAFQHGEIGIALSIVDEASVKAANQVLKHGKD